MLKVRFAEVDRRWLQNFGIRWTQQKPFAGQMTDWVFDYSFNNFIVFEGDLHPDFPGCRPVLIKRISFFFGFPSNDFTKKTALA